MELAQWVLQDNPGWSRERILAAMKGSDDFKVTLAHPIPVLILYTTAGVSSTGEVRFFDDIYGQDAELDQALAKRYRAANATSAGPAPRPHE